jgi:hypothetical protein
MFTTIKLPRGVQQSGHSTSSMKTSVMISAISFRRSSCEGVSGPTAMSLVFDFLGGFVWTVISSSLRFKGDVLAGRFFRGEGFLVGSGLERRLMILRFVPRRGGSGVDCNGMASGEP